MYLGKPELKKNTPQNDLDCVLLLSFSMGLTMQGAERAGSGPKGVQMQQTDLPAAAICSQKVQYHSEAKEQPISSACH